MTFAHLKPTVATLSRIIDRSGQRPREAVHAWRRALLSAPARTAPRCSGPSAASASTAR